MNSANFMQVIRGHCFRCHTTYEGAEHICVLSSVSPCDESCPHSINESTTTAEATDLSSEHNALEEQALPTPHDNTGQSVGEIARKTVDYLYTIEESTVIGELSPEIFQAISTLRQLVNEEFVVKDKSISSQLIYDILSPSVAALINQVRINERKEVALDNYWGHTFSDSTNWEGKYQKFIENNEKRIQTLTNNAKEGKE